MSNSPFGIQSSKHFTYSLWFISDSAEEPNSHNALKLSPPMAKEGHIAQKGI